MGGTQSRDSEGEVQMREQQRRPIRALVLVRSSDAYTNERKGSCFIHDGYIFMDNLRL